MPAAEPLLPRRPARRSLRRLWVTVKLDYLRDLGVDYIWLTPSSNPPLKGSGYDIAGYPAIDPVFGTAEDKAIGNYGDAAVRDGRLTLRPYESAGFRR